MPNVVSQNGPLLLFACKLRLKLIYQIDSRKAPSADALVKEDQKRLWAISEEMVGIKQNA
jgi:hypothetical protein